MKKFVKFALFCATAIGTLAIVSCDKEEPQTTETKKYTITVTNDGNGSAVADMVTALEGEIVKLTATEDKLTYLFSRWTVVSGDAVLNDPTARTTTFTMPAGDVEIKAEFAVDPSTIRYNITVTNDGNGTAYPSTNQAAQNAEITLMAEPNENYAFKRWVIVVGEPDDLDMSDATKSPAIFYMPAYDVEIKAEFALMLGMDFIVDDALRTYCVKFDLDGDGYLSQSEIDAATVIDVQRWDDTSPAITTLEGIERFTNLTDLNVLGHMITEIDLSPNTELVNVDCSRNVLTNLTLTGLTKLKSLTCSANKFTTLDLSPLTALETLYCGSTSTLTSVDLSNNVALKYLSCGASVTSLDITKNVNLETLAAKSCKFETLDVSKNTAIKKIEFGTSSYLTRAAIKQILTDLPMRAVADNAVIGVRDCENWSSTQCATEKAAAEAKNWTVDY